eukprot:1029375-Rhodomonas_salina.1
MFCAVGAKRVLAQFAFTRVLVKEQGLGQKGQEKAHRTDRRGLELSNLHPYIAIAANKRIHRHPL